MSPSQVFFGLWMGVLNGFLYVDQEKLNVLPMITLHFHSTITAYFNSDHQKNQKLST
jgi:hypothetical protein